MATKVTRMQRVPTVVRELAAWARVQSAPLVLLPLGAVLVWVAVWRVWLPSPGTAVPSRRSVTLAIVLLILGVSSVVIGIFHDRLRRIELTRTGLTVTLTGPEKVGLGSLVEQLAQQGASPEKVAEAARRFLEAVQTTRPSPVVKTALAPGVKDGLTEEQAAALAGRIAAEVG